LNVPASTKGVADANDVAALQGAKYDRQALLYEAHATERSTQRYRRRFIDEPLLKGIPLDGRDVLEATCGSGHSTGLLLERGARVTGLDVSDQVLDLFHEKWPSCDAVAASILEPPFQAASFDVVMVVGGLHHVHPHVEEAVAQIWRMLKPGGFFCFCEPHTGSLMDVIRRRWYARDVMFDWNEAAVDIAGLHRANLDKFEVVTERYFGNVAHTLVLNSMILRAPLWLKRIYARPAMALERVLNPILGRRLACSVSCQWQKRG
jgi:ubiquinone/menaquinone biosynthesis C-methylase UbiE